MKNFRNISKYKKQSGYGLIEILVALVILAFLFSVLYNQISATEEQKIARAVTSDFQLLDRMIVGVRGPSAFSLAGVTEAEVAATDKSGKLSRNPDANGNNQDIVVAGNYNVANLTDVTVANSNGYELEFGNFSDQACVNVIQALWSYVDELDAGTGPTPLKTAPNQEIGVGGAPTATDIATACSGNNTPITVRKRINSV
jgi:prepilin-type N-terminal cleavage/methylation domain-containing protein